MNADDAQRVALVAGANGLIGRHLLAHLSARGWPVVALSRRPVPEGPACGVAVDLADPVAAHAVAPALSAVTHAFYCVRADHPEGVPESEALNTTMLRNLLDALAVTAARLAHVNLVHGTKYYGHHLGPIPLPAVESGPRGPGGTYYFAQQDLLAARSSKAGWTWTIARPHSFCFAESGNPRSLVLALAVFAAVQRELGEPLFYPGSARSYQARTQFTDLGLLTRAIEWMATTTRCADRAFNVVNGDYPSWRELWPRLARLFGMTAAPPRGIRLPDYMKDKGPVWDAVVAKHGLRPAALDQLVLWPYGDYVFAPEWDIMSSMETARRHGFDERVDTVGMFERMFAEYRAHRLIP